MIDMKKLFYIIGGVALGAAVACSCSDDAKWTLKGNIEGATEGSVILEAANPGGYWYAIDTMDVDANGDFATAQAAAEYPDIYRLNYGGKYIYFPIDSIENLSLKTSAASFANGYELDGSEDAKLVAHVDKRLNDFLLNHRVEDLDTAQTLKRELSGMIIGNPTSVVSFYIVSKQIGGHPLFRNDNRKELGIIGAVANAYSENRPNDPRTLYLKDLWIKNRSRFSTPTDTIAASQISFPEIKALDEKGVEQSLTDVASKNKTVILNFTQYEADYSQALNLALRELYDARHDAGLQIYQIGFSPNEYQWRIAAGNQPWVTVFNGTTDANLLTYNVGSLPALFIIHNGELVERVTSVDALKSAVARYN